MSQFTNIVNGLSAAINIKNNSRLAIMGKGESYPADEPFNTNPPHINNIVTTFPAEDYISIINAASISTNILYSYARSNTTTSSSQYNNPLRDFMTNLDVPDGTLGINCEPDGFYGSWTPPTYSINGVNNYEATPLWSRIPGGANFFRYTNANNFIWLTGNFNDFQGLYDAFSNSNINSWTLTANNLMHAYFSESFRYSNIGRLRISATLRGGANIFMNSCNFTNINETQVHINRVNFAANIFEESFCNGRYNHIDVVLTNTEGAPTINVGKNSFWDSKITDFSLTGNSNIYSFGNNGFFNSDVETIRITSNFFTRMGANAFNNVSFNNFFFQAETLNGWNYACNFKNRISNWGDVRFIINNHRSPVMFCGEGFKLNSFLFEAAADYNAAGFASGFVTNYAPLNNSQINHFSLKMFRTNNAVMQLAIAQWDSISGDTLEINMPYGYINNVFKNANYNTGYLNVAYIDTLVGVNSVFNTLDIDHANNILNSFSNSEIGQLRLNHPASITTSFFNAVLGNVDYSCYSTFTDVNNICLFNNVFNNARISRWNALVLAPTNNLNVLSGFNNCNIGDVAWNINIPNLISFSLSYHDSTINSLSIRAETGRYISFYSSCNNSAINSFDFLTNNGSISSAFNNAILGNVLLNYTNLNTQALSASFNFSNFNRLDLNVAGLNLRLVDYSFTNASFNNIFINAVAGNLTLISYSFVNAVGDTLTVDCTGQLSSGVIYSFNNYVGNEVKFDSPSINLVSGYFLRDTFRDGAVNTIFINGSVNAKNFMYNCFDNFTLDTLRFNKTLTAENYAPCNNSFSNVNYRTIDLGGNWTIFNNIASPLIFFSNLRPVDLIPGTGNINLPDINWQFNTNFTALSVFPAAFLQNSTANCVNVGNITLPPFYVANNTGLNNFTAYINFGANTRDINHLNFGALSGWQNTRTSSVVWTSTFNRMNTVVRPENDTYTAFSGRINHIRINDASYVTNRAADTFFVSAFNGARNTNVYFNFLTELSHPATTANMAFSSMVNVSVHFPVLNSWTGGGTDIFANANNVTLDLSTLNVLTNGFNGMFARCNNFSASLPGLNTVDNALNYGLSYANNTVFYANNLTAANNRSFISFGYFARNCDVNLGLVSVSLGCFNGGFANADDVTIRFERLSVIPNTSFYQFSPGANNLSVWFNSLATIGEGQFQSGASSSQNSNFYFPSLSSAPVNSFQSFLTSSRNCNLHFENIADVSGAMNSLTSSSFNTNVWFNKLVSVGGAGTNALTSFASSTNGCTYHFPNLTVVGNNCFISGANSSYYCNFFFNSLTRVNDNSFGNFFATATLPVITFPVLNSVGNGAFITFMTSADQKNAPLFPSLPLDNIGNGAFYRAFYGCSNLAGNSRNIFPLFNTWLNRLEQITPLGLTTNTFQQCFTSCAALEDFADIHSTWK